MRAALLALMAPLALLLAACASAPPPPAVYDFGPKPAEAAVVAGVVIVDVGAPPWLAGPGMAYRLDYRDAHRREHYRDSRWAAAPAELLEARLRQRAGGGAVQLRVELEECIQVFASPAQSRVLLRARAITGDGRQRSFELSEAATSPDAAGGVKAASRAADALVAQMLAWAAAPSSVR